MGKRKNQVSVGERVASEILAKLDNDSLERDESKRAYLDVLQHVLEAVRDRTYGMEEEIEADED